MVKEIASDVNDSRPNLLALLKDRQATRIVFERKDRLPRFGFRYLETLLEIQGRTIEVESAGGELIRKLDCQPCGNCVCIWDDKGGGYADQAVYRASHKGRVSEEIYLQSRCSK